MPSPDEPSGLVRLPAAGFRRTPWKNGGGTTIDIADSYVAGVEPGGWTGLRWRFGRTRIEAPAPFSDLTGLDRILTVVAGRGLVLRVADGRGLDAREPFRPLRFSGAWAIVSELESGPVEVVNLMGDPSAVRMDIAFPDPGERVPLPAGEVVLYAPAGAAACRVGDALIRVQGGDAARLPAGPASNFAHESGRLAVVTIRDAA